MSALWSLRERHNNKFIKQHEPRRCKFDNFKIYFDNDSKYPEFLFLHTMAFLELQILTFKFVKEKNLNNFSEND